MRKMSIYKSFNGRSTRGQWSNVYNIPDTVLNGSPEMDDYIAAWVAFEKSFHLDVVHFMRAVVSTHLKGDSDTPEGRPYSVDLAGTGTQPSGAIGTVVALDARLLVAHRAGPGRKGNAGYRGVLTEADVQAGGSGEFQISPGDRPFINPINNGATLGVLFSNPIYIASRGTDTGNPGRMITKLQVVGVSVKKLQIRRKKKVTAETAEQANNLLAEAATIIGAVAAMVLTRGKALPLLQRAGIAANVGGLVGAAGQIVEFLESLIEPAPPAA
jgi:hypothetical protein